MPDMLEKQLAARLRSVGDAVPDTIEPPADLELLVRRRRRTLRRTTRAGVLTAAAVAAGVFALIAVFAAAEPSVEVVDPPPSPVARGAVMLDARGTFVVAIDANARQLSTLASVERGNLSNAQLTNDHRTLWYQSTAGIGGTSCGEILRADVLTGVSHKVGQGLAYAISPDGSRLAVVGEGLDECRAAARPLPAIAWTSDGGRLVRARCAGECEPVRMYDVSHAAPQRVRDGSIQIVDIDVDAKQLAFGPDALFAVAPGGRVRKYDAASFDGLGSVTDERVEQVIPTVAGTFVVQRGSLAAVPELSLVVDGDLRLVRSFADFGTLTPIRPVAR
jgi:hypothetical protein